MTERQKSRLSLALEANRKLSTQALSGFDSSALTIGIVAHNEIARAPFPEKCTIFYRHFLPLDENLVELVADAYRRYFKLGLAHPREAGPDPHEWVLTQLQAAVATALEWIKEWHILACEGENQRIQHVASVPFVPGQTVSVPLPVTSQLLPPKSWRAPSWLFHIYPLVGVARLKAKHVPPRDSEEKLGEAHTRLLLRWARRSFIWALQSAIGAVWNQETAAAGAVPSQEQSEEKRRTYKRTGWEQKHKLYDAIRKVLTANPASQGTKFCAELDKRHAPPLHDWVKSGEWREDLTWKEAWGDSGLRGKIRRVRQEAMKNR